MKKRFGLGLPVLVVAGLLAGAPVFAQDAAAPNHDEEQTALMEEGGPIYQDNCAACHGANGEGGAGPALINSAVVKSRSAVVFQILYGATDHGMPPFADVLTDQEIAAVATYIRNSWTNEAGVVLPRSVELRRSIPPEDADAQ